MEASPLARDWQARSTATKLLEHAVSMWTLGPSKSKYQLTRLGRIDEKVPVIAMRDAVSGSFDTILE
jgi:hypothetical protein